ncbi:MAG TPA: adenylyl-sulfate kinase [Bacteroidales bacterium]|nr:adenylyl-sulfate kinase [Bacteroidales bacterium]
MVLTNTREQKQSILKQKGHCIWLTGLPGSGKTTIAAALETLFLEHDILVKVFDGDIIRSNINADLDFSEAGRMQNIVRTAHLNTELIACGLVVINAFVSPLNLMRQKAIEIVGKPDFTLIHIDCPLEVCERRDPKGMYAQARQGKLKNFTGISDCYEAPVNPDLVINTAAISVDDAVALIFNFVLPIIKPAHLL